MVEGPVAVRWRPLLQCNVVRSGMLQSYMEVGSGIYRVVVIEWYSLTCVLQCVAVSGSHRVVVAHMCVAVCCSVLQCVAVCCSEW